MSRINFEQLTFSNIRKYGANTTTIDLNKYNLSLLFGKNGNGKSTILESLYFCLYGKGLSKVKKSELVNNVNKKKLLTTLTFSMNSSNYKIIRGIKPDIFEIYKDEVLIEQDSNVNLYQKRLEEIIGIDDKTFYQLVLLNAKYSKFLEMSSTERRALVENILALNIFSEMNEKLKLIKSENDTSLSEALTNIRILKSKLESYESFIDTYKLTETKDNTNEIKALNEEYRVANDYIVAFAEQLIELEKEIEQIESKDEINKLTDELQERIKVGTSRKDSNELLMRQSKELREFLQNHDVCPTCKQSISNDFKALKIKELDDLIDDYNNKITKINNRLNSITQEYKDCKIKINSIIEKEKSFISKKSNLLSNQSTYKSNINIINNKIDELNKADDRNKENEEKINLYKNKINEIDNDLKNLDSVKTKCDKKKTIIDKMGFYLSDKGVKSTIIDKYVDLLNDKVNYYLNQMDFNCVFEIDKMFNDTIKRNNHIQTYSSLSTGEKGRVDIALLFAWLEIAKINNSISTNILFIDEILDNGLDSEGIDNILRLIKTIDDKNIFLISHRNLNDCIFDKIYEVKINSQGFSEIK